MMDHILRPPLVDPHVERIEDELRVQVGRHGPAHDAAAEHIHDHRQEQKAGQGGNIGDVRHPQPVGPLCRETPLYSIGCWPRIAIPHGRLEPFAPTDPDQSRRAHEARHPLVVDPLAFLLEVFQDTGNPIAATRALMQCPDPLAQPGIGLRPCRGDDSATRNSHWWRSPGRGTT